jgi:hypothetical protein
MVATAHQTGCLTDRGPKIGLEKPSRRIGLVGCVKRKAPSARPARDLYVSALFAGRRASVEKSCDEWWILSAEHGLVHPDEVLDPYDRTLKDLSTAERRQWSAQVLQKIDARIGPTSGDVLEIHAGSEYRDHGLVQGLLARESRVEVPTAGLGIGKQLQYYARLSRSS